MTSATMGLTMVWNTSCCVEYCPKTLSYVNVLEMFFLLSPLPLLYCYPGQAQRHAQVESGTD